MLFLRYLPVSMVLAECPSHEITNHYSEEINQNYSVRPQKMELDFEVDKLTNSIENAISGEVFDTLISLVGKADRKLIRKTDWNFSWSEELTDKTKQV